MNFLSSKTDAQLKKWNRISLAIAIGILLLMFVITVASLFQISGQTESVSLPLLVPIVPCPLIMVPLFFSAAISQELKIRFDLNL